MAENELSKKLEGLLSDPEALSQVIKMAGSLMGSMGTPENTSSPTKAEADAGSEAVREAVSEAAATPGESSPDLSAVLPVMAGLFEKNGKNDPRCSLLYALKPFMSHGRAERIDAIVNMLRIAETAGGLLGSGGLFK